MSSSATPSRSLLGRLLAPVLILACLAGGIAGSLFLGPKSEPQAKADTESSSPKDVKAAPTPESIIARAEEAIRATKFEEALKLLPKDQPQEGKTPAAAFLRGLALEGAGKYAEALAAYKAATDTDRDPTEWAPPALGTVRVALALGDFPTARNWLARVELRSGHPNLRFTRVMDECRMLRARLDVARLPTPKAPDPLDDTAAAVAPFDLTGAYLDWLTDGWRFTPEDSPDSPPPPTTLPTGLTVRSSKDGYLVTGQLPDLRVTDVLRALANAGNWKLRLPSDLPTQMASASVAFSVRDMPVSQFLVALTEPVGLHWQLDDTLSVQTSPHSGVASPTNIARDSLELAAECQDHPHVRAAAVRLAVLYEQIGRIKAATDRYSRILTDTPHAAEAVHAGYNLGLIRLRAGDPDEARSTFREVIDRGGKTRWTDLGYWWTGRTYLDECNPAAAFKPFRQALSGKDRTSRSAAALGVVLCHILQGNETAAYDTLDRHVLASADAHASLAKLFEEYLRHSTTPTRGRAENLFESLVSARPTRLGSAGVYLAGQVYRELGFTARTIAIYEKAIEDSGPWAPRLTLALGEILMEQDQFEEARQHLLAVVAVETGPLNLKAELHLTELDLRTGRLSDAMLRCQRLRTRTDIDDAAVLMLLGRVHEAAGEPLKAAACFAGKLPPQDD